MAYILIQSAVGEELARHPLTGLVVIGRSPQCDIRIHDHRISREHCGLEPGDGGWVVVDLYSSNGTVVNGERIDRRRLEDRDRLFLGQTIVTFIEGAMPLPRFAPKPAGPCVRPADPFEALSSTLVDFQIDEEFDPPVERTIHRPTPRPLPKASDSATAVAIPALRPAIAAKARGFPKRLPIMLSVGETEAVEAKPDSRWRRKVRWLVVETVLLAGLAGTAVVGALMYLGRV